MSKSPKTKRKQSNNPNSQAAQTTDNTPATLKPAKPKKGGNNNAAATQPNTVPQTPKKKKPRKQSRDPKGRGKRR